MGAPSDNRAARYMRLIGTLPKNSREAFHFSAGTFRGEPMFAVQLMRTGPDGNLRPGPPALYVKARLLPGMIALLKKGVAALADERVESGDAER